MTSTETTASITRCLPEAYFGYNRAQAALDVIAASNPENRYELRRFWQWVGYTKMRPFFVVQTASPTHP